MFLTLLIITHLSLLLRCCLLKIMRVQTDSNSTVGIIFDSGRSRILLLNIYAPTYGKDLEFSDHLDHLTALFGREDSKFDEIITMGDWNLNEKSEEGRVEEMDVWLTQRGMIRLDPPLPTHRHFLQNDWTYLDCAYVTDPSNITVSNTAISFITTSDHQPITAKIKLTVTPPTIMMRLCHAGLALNS